MKPGDTVEVQERRHGVYEFSDGSVLDTSTYETIPGHGGANMAAESLRSTPRMTKARLLDAAKETVAGRGKNYGTPEDNFMRIANHWEMFLLNRHGADKVQFCITPGDVAIMMALMKIARLENDPTHSDSWIDLAGYAACGCEIETAGEER